MRTVKKTKSLCGTQNIQREYNVHCIEKYSDFYMCTNKYAVNWIVKYTDLMAHLKTDIQGLDTMIMAL